MIKLLFFGSDEFPTPILKKLHKSTKIKVVGLVTSYSTKDRPFQADDLTHFTKKKNIPTFYPKNLDKKMNTIFETTKPDIILVCNYGQLLSEEMINFPKYRSLNIHASLLPKLRGACPIESAILQNLKRTGITIQLMEKTLDTGDILFQKGIEIAINETGGSLQKKLQRIATENIDLVIINWVSGKIKPQKQNHSKATYCSKKDISKKAAKIVWNKSAEEIEGMIRAFNPSPIAWTQIETKKASPKLKIFEAEKKESTLKLSPGRTKREKSKLLVQTKRGLILPQRVQLEGKKVMTIENFLNGFRDNIEFS